MLKLKERHGSPYWYLRGTVRGISVDESTGVAISNTKAADEYRIKREAELLEESIHGKRVTASFAQAALSYLEQGGQHTDRLDEIITYFGTMPLAKIGQDVIDKGAAVVFPNYQGSSRRTAYYAPVSSILNHAHKRGWCDKIEFEWPSANAGVVRWLTKEEAHRFISEGGHLTPLLTFLFYTGARISEALGLQHRDLDLDRRHVQFIDTKNGTDRGVPLHPLVVEALRAMLSKHRPNGGDVFRREDGTEYDHEIQASTLVWSPFHTARKRAGIENFRIHDTRHTWATWHYQANRDLGALQKLGGWKTLAMVMRYAHTNVDELSDTIARL
jgi:integrase